MICRPAFSPLQFFILSEVNARHVLLILYLDLVLIGTTNEVKCHSGGFIHK